MDCVISGPSAVKLFCSSVSCLSKIGKDLYIEHDVASGVVLRALNDSKSAYASFRFAPSFFERCSGGTTAAAATTRSSSRGSSCSAPGKRARHHSPADPPVSSSQASSSVSSGVVSVRVAMRAMAPIVKPRKDVRQLRVTSLLEESPMRLAFEFLVVKRSGGGGAHGGGGGGSGRGGSEEDGTVIRVVHCIPANDADAVSAVVDTTVLPSEIVCPPRTLLRLLEPLSRFKDVTEVALLVQKTSSVLTAQSFHHTDKYRVVAVDPPPPQQQATATSAAATAAPVPVLQWVQRERDASRVVKTEASMSLEELELFAFQDDRVVGGDEDDDEGDDDDRQGGGARDLPDHVNDGVVLVFPVKEARAFLQFGAASFGGPSAPWGSASGAAGAAMPWQLESTRVQFHWGGRPVVMEMSAAVDGDGEPHGEYGNDGGRGSGGRDGALPGLSYSGGPSPFTARLVLASLDHTLLTDPTAGDENENDNERTMNP